MRAFGCDLCCGQDAPSDFAHLENVAILVESSHFDIGIQRCRACGQRFVRIWTELVNRGGGDDAMYTDWVPVDETEVERILGMGRALDLGFLGSLGEDRRYLSQGYPSNGGYWLKWRTGSFPVMPGG